jgi:CDP-glycerol glycerophosphotransferase (TagB/SpsB family)
VGIKTLRIRNIVKQKNMRYHVFLEGRYWLDYIRSLGWEDRADFHVTGLPKLDPLFTEGFYDGKALKKKLNLNPGRKTILFAPSYKPSCIGEIGERIIDLVPEYNLIVKLHPYSWGGKYAPHSQHRIYQRLEKKHEGFFLAPKNDFDVYPYLNISDTVISDTSSVINEFLALGGHGVIYQLDHERLKHSDGMPVLSIDPADWLRGAFPHITSPGQLSEAVKKALAPDEEMRCKLNEYRNYFFTGLDGKASCRVKGIIDGILKTPKTF